MVLRLIHRIRTFRARVARLGGAHSPARRGFTLAELMIVVLIMGVLAALASRSMIAEMRRSKSIEATGVIRSIAAAEESYRAQNKFYLDLGTGFYPDDNPGVNKRTFYGHAGEAPWRELAPRVPALIQYSYRARAGLPGTAPVDNTDFVTHVVPSPPAIPFPAANNINEPWYVIQALGDTDGDGTQSMMLATSFNSLVYSEQVGIE